MTEKTIYQISRITPSEKHIPLDTAKTFEEAVQEVSDLILQDSRCGWGKFSYAIWQAEIGFTRIDISFASGKGENNDRPHD